MGTQTILIDCKQKFQNNSALAPEYFIYANRLDIHQKAKSSQVTKPPNCKKDSWQQIRQSIPKKSKDTSKDTVLFLYFLSTRRNHRAKTKLGGADATQRGETAQGPPCSSFLQNAPRQRLSASIPNQDSRCTMPLSSAMWFTTTKKKRLPGFLTSALISLFPVCPDWTCLPLLPKPSTLRVLTQR